MARAVTRTPRSRTPVMVIEALTVTESFFISNLSAATCTFFTARPEMSPTLFSHSGSQLTASGVEHAIDLPKGHVAYAQSPFSNPVTKCSSKIERSK